MAQKMKTEKVTKFDLLCDDCIKKCIDCKCMDEVVEIVKGDE